MSSWAVDRQEQRALKSSICVLFAVGVGVAVGASLGVAVVAVVARGVLVGAVLTGLLIIWKSSSGSLGMFLSLSDDPLVQVYLP